MEAVRLFIQWFCKEVYRLVIHSDVVYTDLLTLDVIPKVMELFIEVFCSGSIFVDSSHFQSPAVILEYTTVHSGFRCHYRITSLFHLLQQLHYGDHISEGVAQAGVIAFGRRQSHFGL